MSISLLFFMEDGVGTSEVTSLLCTRLTGDLAGERSPVVSGETKTVGRLVGVVYLPSFSFGSTSTVPNTL